MKVSEKSISLSSTEMIILRSPVAGEAQAVLDFLRTLHHESWENMNNPPGFWDGFSVKKEAEILTTFAESSSQFMIAAFFGDKIVANLGLVAEGGGLTRHCGELGMGVLREYQGKKLGTALMTHCLGEAKNIGIMNIRLRVRTFNKPAIHLYEKFGFTKVGLFQSAAEISKVFADEFYYQKLL